MKNHNTNKRKFLITIGGPTAVGKTELIIDLANQYNCEIFSADSRQIYKEMNIGTAKPTLQEQQKAKFHLIDFKSINEKYSAGQFEKDFSNIITPYYENHDIGILSGGTGLYIRAALEGLDYFPEVSEDIISLYNTKLTSDGLEPLQKELIAKDPTYSKTVDLSNSRRVLRALQIIHVSDKPYSSFLNQKEGKSFPFETIKICLTRERQELYERINKRVDLMMQNGFLEEVKSLVVHKDLRALDTVGYREMFDYLDEKITLERAVELMKRNSRRYAKRQMSWYRNQSDWVVLDASTPDLISQFIEEKINTAL